MCFVCNETLVMSKPDMQIHVFNCRSTDTEVIEEAENEMTQETLVGNQVSQEAPRSASTGSFQGRFSRVDSSRSGTGSPSSSLARSTSLSGASERSSVTPLTQDMAHTGTPRAQSTGTSTGTSGIGTCTYTPSASGISSSSRNLVTPTSSGHWPDLPPANQEDPDRANTVDQADPAHVATLRLPTRPGVRALPGVIYRLHLQSPVHQR